MMRRIPLGLLALLPMSVLAQEPVAPNDAAAGNDTASHPEPAMVWHFEEGKAEGPRAPIYGGFSTRNMAAFSDGKKPVLVVNKSQPTAHPLTFGLHDSITLEAWVKAKDIPDGGLVYIVGKGRSKGGSKNQNYALRLKGPEGSARLSFLFATPASGSHPSGWHRWTSNDNFNASEGWHHVAVTYTFGDAKSIQGYIDGKATEGVWDMDGPSNDAPVSDDDDLILGTGNGGGTHNSYIGWMDEVAIWRTALPAEVLESRYQVAPAAPAVVRTDLPAGAILVEICENGMPAKNAWPTTTLKATQTYQSEAFGFVEEPHPYVDTGVRGDRAIPHLFRASSVVTLPEGKHRMLLRGRGASRLYIDGKAVLSTPFPPADSSGHGLVANQKDYLDLGPDFRFRPPGNREAWCEFQWDGKPHTVMLEEVVGGIVGKAKRRPELGETVVAWSKQGTTSWELLTPTSNHISYTDAGWAAYEQQVRAQLEAMDAAARAKVREENRGYWDKRRQAAAEWLASTPEVSVPALPAGFTASNPIDQFIAAKIVTVAAQMKDAQVGTVDYFKQVRPILEAKCYECHRGSKAKGKLSLDDVASALKGGKSGDPAVAPGKPDASQIMARVTSKDDDEVMPPKGDRLTKDEVAILQTWIKEGAHWPEFRVENTKPTPLSDDLAFLRRVALDTVGVVPSLEEINAFLADSSPDRRAKVIDRLLADPRWADNWMGYWEDVLAENPNMLNPTLNNTGPFRWWIYESLQDNKPMDLFVTELIRMNGSQRFGGPAGFAVASQNDVPMAAKGTIVSGAFLGEQMKCARCHDSPANKWLQEDLFSLGAMLNTASLEVAKTSSVPLDRIHEGGRKPLIQVTLKPGTKVQPKWPFGEFCDAVVAQKLAEHPENSRDLLAAAITAPQNQRFAQVIANRVWARFMGRGIVEPVDDWGKAKPTHPQLMQWLGREFVRDGYDVKKLARLILNSQVYQRATDLSLREPSPLYVSPAPRRLAAEQLVDSLFFATGKPFRTEEVSLDIDCVRDSNSSISLGQPKRAWMLTSTSNERDRPSLNLPRIAAVADVLSAFGWRGSRQDPLSKREEAPNSLQPAILSNGIMSTWLTVLSDDHGITKLALESDTLDELVDRLFLKLLTRHPTSAERQMYTSYLREGFDHRIISAASTSTDSGPRKPRKYVSWSNHLDAEATIVRQQEEMEARRGDPPTTRLDPAWRSKMEDLLWSMLNAPEWLYTP